MSEAAAPVNQAPQGNNAPNIESSAIEGGHTSELASSIDDYITPEELSKLSKRKVKVKIDGSESDIALEEAIKNYSHKSAAHKRFEEAAELRKQTAQERAQLEEAIKYLQDPSTAKNVLRKYLGDDGFEKLAHDVVLERIQRESMTPEEIERHKEKSELEELRKFKSQREEETKKAERQKLVDTQLDSMSKNLGEFVQRQGGTIQPYEMDSLLGTMISAIDKGYELTLDEAWATVQKQEAGRYERYLNSVDVSKLSPEFIKKVQKHLASNLPMRKQSIENQPAQKQVEEKIDAADYFKKMRR